MTEQRIKKHLRRALDELTAAIDAFPQPPEELLAPFDNGPKLRPHSIEGWWQLWSGGICIALLTPEDVAPLRGKP